MATVVKGGKIRSALRLLKQMYSTNHPHLNYIKLFASSKIHLNRAWQPPLPNVFPVLLVFVVFFFVFQKVFSSATVCLSFRHGTKNGCSGYEMCRNNLHSPLFLMNCNFQQIWNRVYLDDVTVPKQRDCKHLRYKSFLTVRHIKVMKRFFLRKHCSGVPMKFSLISLCNCEVIN